MAALVEVGGLTKSFGGVRALDSVDLAIQPAEFHALCGENGAGKSTLINILCGALEPTEGRISFQGVPLPLGSVGRCEEAGISAIHQEPVSFPDLGAVDNVFLGRELRGLFIRRSAMREQTEQALSRLGMNLDLNVPVGRMSMAERQMVAIARALVRRTSLLILDEPTAALSAKETEALFEVLKRLQFEGVAIVYVSHRLDEVFQLADVVTVLRDGKKVATEPVAALDKNALIRLMVGREVSAERQQGSSAGKIALRVRGLSLKGGFAGIDLDIREGEVVGLAGLVGSGRTELLETVFGVRRPDSGTVQVGDQNLRPGSVESAMAAGVALVPEDRQHHGLIPEMRLSQNLTLADMKRLAPMGWISSKREADAANSLVGRFGVRTGGIELPANSLSGGNQQKVVLAKWLWREPKVLLLDEPTRGVDVGAKEEVHTLIRDLAKKGAAVLMASSDMPELLSVCDRILAMREGRLNGEALGAEADEPKVLSMILPAEGGAD